MQIDVITEDNRWRGNVALVRKAANATLLAQRRSGQVTIMLSNDAHVRKLNKQHRGKDKPTNVLSFPNGEKFKTLVQLGDIILAYETIVREAEEQGKKMKNHVVHLTVHGVLHLLGFDHENESEADLMEAYEITILKRMGIANPYESA